MKRRTLAHVVLHGTAHLRHTFFPRPEPWTRDSGIAERSHACPRPPILPTPRRRRIATTIGVMPLFTVILEFDGGTYISQFQARSAQRAAANCASHLVGIKGMSTPANRKRLARCLLRERPIAIQGVRNVWCCSASIGKKLALVNIVGTL